MWLECWIECDVCHAQTEQAVRTEEGLYVCQKCREERQDAETIQLIGQGRRNEIL